jgi:hypothetical protein
VTAAQRLKRFATETHRLARLWGINDWDLRVVAQKHNSDALATCSPRSVARVVTLALNTKAAEEMPPEALARHEMCHVLLGEFSCIAQSRYVTEDEIRAAEEALVQRLLRLLPA